MSDALILSAAGTAIVGLATYIVTLHTTSRKESREDHKEMRDVVHKNSEAFSSLKASVDANTKSTDALNQTVAHYVRKGTN